MATQRFAYTKHLYVGCVVLIGSAAIGHSAYALYSAPIWRQWFLLAALTLLSGSVTIRIPSVGATISVSETFVFTSVLLFGPSAGALIAALDGLIISLWLQRRDPSLTKTLFNMAAPALSIWMAAELFFASAGVSPLFFNNTAVSTLLPSLVLLAAVYFILNSWLMAWAVALDRNGNALQIWRHDFLWVSLNFFGGASVAALLVSLNREVTFGAIAVIVPLLVISYLTFKTAVGRIEDATMHLTQLNKLYLSTIETLAMAIDAKDQITHGHIRRVQQYAIGLAQVLGVRDESQIRAIEAAALLHDMGKLAVPEYILNKPGKLTVAEFEKMKVHASVGADILSAIDFPYPVVPIVRHHHENWDGTGYPDGLAGTDIPIGARILSVVDCFDALTSDRPYRPRLTDEEALQVLRDRRGSMYDPFIVDTFMVVYHEITPQLMDTSRHRPGLSEINQAFTPTDDADRHSGLENISSGADEMLALYELARALSGKAGLQDTGDIIAKHVRRMIPAQLCVFYLYDADKDELVAQHVTGTSESVIHGLRIGFGQRIAGWVAANRHTIINSDPALDLSDLARTLKPRLRSALSTPLVTADRIVGVLSLYSPAEHAFSDDHRRIIEAVARQISDTMSMSARFEIEHTSALRDQSTGLPLFEQLSRIAPLESPISAEFSLPVSLIFIELRPERMGQTQLKSTITGVIDAIRRHLRAADFVFSYSDTQFVALLTQTENSIANKVAGRITASCQPDVSNRIFQLRIGVATAPEHGASLTELLRIARATSATDDGKRPSPPHIH